MPRRRNRDEESDRERRESLERLSKSLLGPPAARIEGYVVRSSSSPKLYRCPFCQGNISPGTGHIVAYAEGRLDDRRHYHSACWSRHARSLRSP